MRVLFIVHGMGVHGDDWAGPVAAKLEEVASRYQFFQRRPRTLADEVDIVPIGYDGEFTQHLERWNEETDALRAFAETNQALGDVVDLLDWLDDVDEVERNFFWSHAVDVALYRYFQLVTRPVRLRIMKGVVDQLTTRMRGGAIVQASIMAHSLGTSVTHDALADLSSEPIVDSRGRQSDAFMAGNFAFENIFMVANVSRVLQTSPTPDESHVHPRSVRPLDAYCAHYYTFRHGLDPFPAVSPFDPQDWGNLFHAVAGLDHIHQPNVHDWEHYLDHPRVHIDLLNALLHGVIGDDERDAAIEEYPRVDETNPCAVAADEARGALENVIGAVRRQDDPIKLIMAGVKFGAKVKELRNACAEG